MSDLEDKLGSILTSPEKMAQIMKLAQSFSSDPPQQSAAEPFSQTAGQDAQMLETLTRLIKEMSVPDGNIALLRAIAPYLKQERREKVERAIRIARIAKLAGRALGESGGFGLV